MKLKFILAATAVALVAAGLAAVKLLQFRKMAAAGRAFAQPAESVSSAMVRVQHWPETLQAIGTVSAVQGVTVAPEVAGTVSEIAFESGNVVAKGDLLLRQDTSLEEAQLRSMEAQAHLADLDAARVRKLRAANMVSQSDLDTAEATLQQAQANADAIRAAIEKKTLRAPFAGKLGIRQVNVGEYLDAGKPIVSLQALSPAYADFSLPQQELARLKPGMPVRVTVDTYPDRQFEGTLTAMNPDLDAASRSVGLQASFENGDLSLRPGMFVRVEVLLPAEKDAMVIPATSVLSAPYGDSVYVIEARAGTNGASADRVARQQFIRVGRARGDFVSVESGLKAGDRIASSGLFKLRNGARVIENNRVVPGALENPQPPDK